MIGSKIIELRNRKEKFIMNIVAEGDEIVARMKTNSYNITKENILFIFKIPPFL